PRREQEKASVPTQTQPQHEGGPTAVPRPEYPRPQFTRPEWLCLNGPWEFEIDRGDSGLERGLAGAGLSGAITVPFCPESELSGAAHTVLRAAGRAPGRARTP